MSFRWPNRAVFRKMAESVAFFSKINETRAQKYTSELLQGLIAGTRGCDAALITNFHTVKVDKGEWRLTGHKVVDFETYMLTLDGEKIFGWSWMPSGEKEDRT